MISRREALAFEARRTPEQLKPILEVRGIAC